MFSFWGFEQPFYVLAEAKSPRKYFPKYTVLAFLLVSVLYLLVNVSYLLVIDKSDLIPLDSPDLASVFFERLFNGDQEKGARAMATLVAICIFGNLWVMTFTAARVKQEIAKEAILPWSLYLATSYKTPYGLWKKWFSRRDVPDEEVEQAPTAAFGLHWFSSVLLLALVAPIANPSDAYGFLVQLYTYTIVALLCCWVCLGLVRTKIDKSKWHWQKRRRYRPWMSPVHVIIFGIATAFIVVAAFVPPTHSSPFYDSGTGTAWYVVPVVGITGPLWGVLWYWGLLAYEWKIGRHLVVSREAYWKPDPDYPGEYIQQAEIIDHTWQITLRSNMSEDFVLSQAETEEVKGPVVTQHRDTFGSDVSSELERGRGEQDNSNNNSRLPMSSARRLSDRFED